MFRVALAFAFVFTAPALVATAEPLDEWDDRTTLEDDNTHTLDSVDTGSTHDLDDVDTGRTHDLDEVDTGGTHELDAVDTGHTESLDSVETRSDDRAEPPASPPASSMPAVQQGDWEGQASHAEAMIEQAEARLREANAAYSEMRARDYPRGDAAAQIIAERQAAERGLNDAGDYLAKIKRAAEDAGRPL